MVETISKTFLGVVKVICMEDGDTYWSLRTLITG